MRILNISRSIAKVASVILHPYMVVFYYGLVAFFRTNQFVEAAVIISCGFLCPIVTLFVIYKMRVINSLDMQQRKQRTPVYVATIMWLLLGTFLLYVFKFSMLSTYVFLMSTIAVIIVTIINGKWKISAHMAGQGGMCAIIVSLYSTQSEVLILAPLFFVIALVVAWARYHLKSHTISQLLAGYAVGFLIMIIPFILQII